jgi:hypothetical protein
MYTDCGSTYQYCLFAGWVKLSRNLLLIQWLAAETRLTALIAVTGKWAVYVKIPLGKTYIIVRGKVQLIGNIKSSTPLKGTELYVPGQTTKGISYNFQTKAVL